MRANKSKNNSSGRLLNISKLTGSRITPLVNAENRMLRRMRKKK